MNEIFRYIFAVGRFKVGFLSVLAAALVAAPGCVQAQQRPVITGIAFVRISTSDAKASQAFYRDLLGFEPVRGVEATRYRVNDLQWFEVANVPVAPELGRGVEIGFSTRDVVAMQRYLHSHDIAIEHPLHHGMFEVRDPEGRLIAFVQEKAATSPALPRAVSHRLIHSGFIVRDRALEDGFYRDLLGFHLFWEGGQKEGVTDWTNMQVPEGSDCIEYMLRQASKPPIRQMGIMNHMAFGTTVMSTVQQRLRENGCSGENCGTPQMGREGKKGMNLYDPDLTRVEFIEYQPSGPDMGSPFTGIHPQEKEDR